MRIGYPCINTSIRCKSSRTFRLKSYSEKCLMETVENNLVCLGRILRFNLKHNILFFRITSDLVPFASHPIRKFDWQGSFGKRLKGIGDFTKSCGVRISIHPDQFTRAHYFILPLGILIAKRHRISPLRALSSSSTSTGSPSITSKPNFSKPPLQ